jgi:hypothetical protein
MKKDGIIDFDGRNITLLNIARLEAEVVEGLQYSG